jgi:hypothetical protein
MPNTRQIQPINIWTSKGSKSATIFSLTNFFDYHFDDGSGKVNYKLIGIESAGTTTDENGNVVTLPDVAVEYASEVIEIPSSVIQQWGSSDEIIWSFICSQLNIITLNNK